MRQHLAFILQRLHDGLCVQVPVNTLSQLLGTHRDSEGDLGIMGIVGLVGTKWAFTKDVEDREIEMWMWIASMRTCMRLLEDPITEDFCLINAVERAARAELPVVLTTHQEKYKEYEKDVAIEEIDGLQLVKKLAKNMEEMFHKKSEAVRMNLEASYSLFDTAVLPLAFMHSACAQGPASDLLMLGPTSLQLHVPEHSLYQVPGSFEWMGSGIICFEFVNISRQLFSIVDVEEVLRMSSPWLDEDVQEAPERRVAVGFGGVRPEGAVVYSSSESRMNLETPSPDARAGVGQLVLAPYQGETVTQMPG
ncbi:Voltage-dependent calcium channel subunit alpha-2/delta-3 [Fukomys damarensis]|uniref:Voltage-dependent calcium channel subunit alpha-2/delta-3 n=1 Tax=Fukomys damarensis TaxID=885580 RepID=A0A091DQU8_FUKDA|nr:Voltage-dependent calcium channel subunit alpha-2/delta-3 [Fukomys damarensis]